MGSRILPKVSSRLHRSAMATEFFRVSGISPKRACISLGDFKKNCWELKRQWSASFIVFPVWTQSRTSWAL